MADEDPFSDEALGLGGRVPLASLGYEQTAEDRQTDPNDPFSNKALGLDANGLPTQGTFADYLWSHSPEGHVLNAFGQGSKDAWGAVSTMRDDTLKALKDAGLHSDFVKSHMDVAKIFNQAFIRPAVNAAALVAGSIAGPINSLMSAGTQVGTEFRAEAEKQNKTLLGQVVAPVLGGIGEIVQSRASGQNMGELNLGGVHAADIAGAERVQARGVLDHIIQGQKDELAETLGRQAATQDGLYKARAEGTIGEGEEGYFNTRVPTDEQLRGRAEAAQEAGLPPRAPEPPQADVEALARQIDPYTFSEYDRLSDLTENLRNSIQNMRSSAVDKTEKDIFSLLSQSGGDESVLSEFQTKRLQNLRAQLEAQKSQYSPQMFEFQKRLIAADEQLRDVVVDANLARDHAKNLIPDGPAVPEVPLSLEMAEARKTGEAPKEEPEFVWRSKEADFPVKPTDEIQKGPDGRDYQKVINTLDNTESYVPKDEIIKAEKPRPTAIQEGATTAGPQAPVYKSPIQKTGSLRSGEEGVFRRGRQQDWSIGNKVNVGFLKNLTVMGKDDNIFVLRAENGKWYATEPHRGLVQLDESEVPKHILPSYPQKEPTSGKATGREQPLATAPEKPVQPPQSLEEGVGTGQPQEGPVEAPKGSQRPSVEGTGDTQTRGLARSLEAKAIKDDLLETGLELPEYRKMALDKELQAVADHTADHYEDAVRIAMGEKAPPEGHYPESYLIAVQRTATARGDVETIKALATRSELLAEATDMGRRLRILAELNKEDPVAAIKTLSEARKNSLARKGVNIQGEVQNISHDIDQRIFDGASNTDLESLIKSIECP